MYAKLAIGNVRKSLRDFGIYFLTTVLGIAVFYAFNAIAEQEATSAVKIMGVLEILVNGVSIFIAVILAFLVIYANRFLIRRRKKEFGLYLCLGMRQGDVVKITLIETAMIGVFSLIIGLVIGFGISQLLMLVSSALLKVEMPGIAIGFSTSALVKTLVLFIGIFVIASLANSRSIMKSKLIDLLQANRINEELRLRSLPLSLTLFIISCIMIGVSYWLLIRNGLMDISTEFFIATALVCIGTFLFFYSLSGFLLRLIQMIKPLYLRGLNMFTLRQLNSKVNTTFFSMSIICITLFLAITSVCGGIGICNALTSSLDKTTSYDSTVRSYFGSYRAGTGFLEEDLGGSGEFAKNNDYDMIEGLRASADTLGIDGFDSLIDEAVQIDFVIDPQENPTFQDLDNLSGAPLSGFIGEVITEDYGLQSIDLVALSHVNDALELAGLAPIELKQGECAIIFDADFAIEYYDALIAGNPIIEVGGKSLTLSKVIQQTLETASFPMNIGALIISDEDMPATVIVSQSVLDVQCTSHEAAAAFDGLCSAIQASTDTNTWPISIFVSKTLVYEQSIGLSTIVAYLAIYIGFVLVVACAAILAIQQLSEASDNAQRYSLLNKLGASKPMINHSLLAQIAIYFVFPLALALAHSVCALQVVTDVVAVLGHLDIGFMALVATAAFLATYGAYFVLTYLGAKSVVKAG